jgi:hypothetical protein
MTMHNPFWDTEGANVRLEQQPPSLKSLTSMTLREEKQISFDLRLVGGCN